TVVVTRTTAPSSNRNATGATFDVWRGAGRTRGTAIVSSASCSPVSVTDGTGGIATSTIGRGTGSLSIDVDGGAADACWTTRAPVTASFTRVASSSSNRPEI